MATRQRTLVTRPQLLGLGLSSAGIDGRLIAGRLHRVFNGVYSLSPILPALAREQAALLACGPGAMLSFLTAAVLWELVAIGGDQIHVSTSGTHRRGPAGVVVHRVNPNVETTTRHGLRVTALPRTLLDLTTTVDDATLARAVNEAQVRHRLSLGALLTFAEGRPGVCALRALAAGGASPTRSEAERRLLTLVNRAGLPRPRTNVRVLGVEVDAYWPEHRLVVEVDGYAFHATKSAFERDHARDAALQAAGLRVLRFTWHQLTQTPERVVAQLAAVLAGPPGSAPPARSATAWSSG